MNIKQLETFVWIVRLGSFAAAAQRLYTTQSTVSVRIHELEAHMGVRLFDRSGHKAALTPKGRQLIPYAERLTALTSEIRERIGSAAALSGVARLGVAELVAITWLPSLCKTVRETHPGVNLDVTMDLANTLVARVAEGELDLALVPGPVATNHLTSQSLGQVEFAWMASRELEIPHGELTPAELAQLPIIGLSQESHHHRTIADWFTDVPHRVVTSCNNMAAVIALTIASRGVSHLPAIACEEAIRAGRLRVLATRPRMPPVEFFAVQAKGRFQPLIHAIAGLAVEMSPFASA